MPSLWNIVRENALNSGLHGWHAAEKAVRLITNNNNIIIIVIPTETQIHTTHSPTLDEILFDSDATKKNVVAKIALSRFEKENYCLNLLINKI